MKYLLDTHTFLWFIHGSGLLSPTAKSAIENEENECYVSAACFWEMAIKISIKKLEIGLPFQALKAKMEDNMISYLPILFEDNLIVSTLPHHHNDPFDRLMISQCIRDQLTLISIDEKIKPYNIQTLW
jgi:PIN domain nuclease of toxin-antitoxin system